ncbi:MAG: hypothetical protein KatS3mg082_2335 [Nitrospiraceae bacterium]|nr:MAG: hypothetical protein KatS3mg082_2335 [Nitrospiraceae bacterium]
MLQYLGHKKLKILDGGWVKWTQEGRPFEHGQVKPQPGSFKAQPVPELIIMKDELKQIVRRPHPETTIVDARSLEEYLGKEVSGIPRPGHIPSAVHVPWNGFLNPDATVKDLAKIRESLEEKGLQDTSSDCLLLHGRRPVGMALFHPQTGGLSQGAQLSRVVVGVEPRFRLSC